MLQRGKERSGSTRFFSGTKSSLMVTWRKVKKIRRKENMVDPEHGKSAQGRLSSFQVNLKIGLVDFFVGLEAFQCITFSQDEESETRADSNGPNTC